MRYLPISKSFLLSVLILTFPQLGFSAGYGLLEQSQEGTSLAYSGSVVGYGDGSEAFYNPAAMTKVPTGTVTAGANIIKPSINFRDEGSTVGGLLSADAAQPNQRDNGPNGGEAVVVPNLYYINQIEEDLFLGLSINAPFGLVTDYSRNWVGRYQGIRSELSVINFATSIGYQVSDSLSLGANVGGLLTRTNLSSAIDFGTIGENSLGSEQASALGLSPQQSDGLLEVDGEDWSLGWSVGLLYEPESLPETSFGISYRGKSTVHFHGGSAKFSVPDSARVLTQGGAFENTGASSRTTLPESISFGISQHLSPSFRLLYEAQWTRWSRFQELEMNFDNPLQPSSIVEQEWENTWRHSIGGQLLLTDNLKLNFGFAYDQTPIPSRKLRTPRIPDNDRYWVATGLSYHYSDNSRINLGYAHLFIPSAKSEVLGPTGDLLSGEWHTSSDQLAFSFTTVL